MGQDTTARVIVQNLKEIFRKSVKTVSVTAGCAKSVRNKTGGGEQMLKTLYLIISYRGRKKSEVLSPGKLIINSKISSRRTERLS